MATEQNYDQLFTSYIVGGLKTSLIRVQGVAGPLAEDDRRQAWHMLSYALAVEDAWPHVRALLFPLTQKMIQAGHWQDWTPYLEQGLARSRAQQDLDAEAELSLHLAYLQQRLGHLTPADRHAGAAVTLFSRQKTRARLGAALNRHAEIKRSRREYAAAEQLVDAALTQLNNEDEADREERGHAYLIKGRIAFDQRLWAKAGRHLARGLELYEGTDNLRRTAICIQNLGRVRSMEKDYDGAAAAYERAIELLKTSNEIFDLAVVQMNLGIIYSLNQKPEAALAAYAQAEPVFRRLRDRAYLARLFNNQGMTMNELGQWEDAQTLLQASSELWLALDNLQGYLNAQESLGAAYLGNREFDRAVHTYQAALAMQAEQTERHCSRQTLENLARGLRRAQAESKAHA